MTRILLEDLKTPTAGYGPLCNRGLRHFFSVHSLDWGDMVRNGVSEEDLLATGDGAVLPYIEIAKQREAG